MYHIKPVVLISDGDIVHTDNMYKIGVSNRPVSIPNAADPTDQFASFLVNSSGARSKLGQALEAMGRHQGDEPEGSYQRAEKQTFRAVPHTEEFNEMNLDKYIIRKMGPVSKLGKYLHSQQESGNHSHQDLEFLHRLKELERVLDSFLVPMGLVKSSEHVPSSLLANTKVSKPTIQPTKHIENPITAPISSFMTNLVSPCASTSMGHIDDNTKLVHRLKELDGVLDGLLVPMGLVSTSEHVPPSQFMDSKVLEPPTQPTKHVEEPATTSVPAPVTSLASPCASPFKSHTDDDAKMINRLKELDEVLDGFLVPMGLVKSSEHVPLSQLADGKVFEPSAQLTKHTEEPATAPTSSSMANLASPCISPSMSHVDDDAKLVHRLKGLDRVLDGLLGPMGLVSTSEHAPPSQFMDSKVLEPPTQPTKHVEEPATTSVPAPVTSLVSPCASPFKSHTDDDAKMINRLKELDEVLDGFLVPMGLVKSSEHVPLSQLADGKVFEPSAQLTKHTEEPATAPTSSSMATLASPCISPSMSHVDDDAKLVHRLKGLDRVLDGLLGPMGLVNTSEHVPPSQFMDSKVLEPPTQPTKHVEEPATTSISAPVTNLVPLLSPPVVDLAIHCDPKTPPFAILLYSKMLKLGGHNVSLQFYKHSTLASIPEHLPYLEKFFTDQPRSSASKLIISVIWRPCALGCMAISNPFTDLPLYGESAILMYLSSLSPDFAQIFQDLSSIDSAVLTKDAGMLVDCIEKFGKTGIEPFSIEELLLFISCEVAGLSSLVQGASKSWFSRCMSNECFATTKKMIDRYH